MGSMKIKYNQGVEISGKDSGYYPSLTIPGKAVPELKDKEIGDTCEIKIKGKLRSMRDDSSSGMSFEVEIKEAEYID